MLTRSRAKLVNNRRETSASASAPNASATQVNLENVASQSGEASASASGLNITTTTTDIGDILYKLTIDGKVEAEFTFLTESRYVLLTHKSTVTIITADEGTGGLFPSLDHSEEVWFVAYSESVVRMKAGSYVAGSDFKIGISNANTILTNEADKDCLNRSPTWNKLVQNAPSSPSDSITLAWARPRLTADSPFCPRSTLTNLPELTWYCSDPEKTMLWKGTNRPEGLGHGILHTVKDRDGNEFTVFIPENETTTE